MMNSAIFEVNDHSIAYAALSYVGHGGMVSDMILIHALPPSLGMNTSLLDLSKVGVTCIHIKDDGMNWKYLQQGLKAYSDKRGSSGLMKNWLSSGKKSLKDGQEINGNDEVEMEN
jgi:hypothetical protein